MSRSWPHVRAGLIAFAIAIGLVEGCPIPPPAETEPWQRGVVDAIRPIQRAVMTPFLWLPRALRITERWALFQSADAERFRLEVTGYEVTGASHPLYRAGDGGPYAAVVEYRRIRGAYNPTDRPPGQYAAFARWFAGDVFRARPDLVAVRFRMEKLQIVDGVPRAAGGFAFEIVERRRR